jgi:hypothetical protein
MRKTLDELAAGLLALFSGPRKGPGPHNRYVLRIDESGNLFFELDEIDLMFVDLLWPENPPAHRFALDPGTALYRYRS